MTEDETVRALTGGWQLVGCTIRHPDGSESKPLGSHPVGQIMYSSDGHMTAHLLADSRDCEPDAPSYIGYFGRFSVDTANRIVTHHVVGASAPAMIGTDQPRHYTLDGNRLTLQADRPDGRASVFWEKRDERAG
jgi:hypothetical protein